MNDVIAKLGRFGLSEKEAGVYISLLELGKSAASEIAIKSGIPRTLVYDILERLIEKGIVSYAIGNRKKYFSASEPEQLVEILQESMKIIGSTIPLLKSLQKNKSSPRPKVEVFEGIEGMKTTMNDILASGTREFLAYGSSKSSFAVMSAFMIEWHRKRVKQKILFRVIYNDSAEARERVKAHSNTLDYARYKFMPITVNSPTANLIYADKVVLQSWTREPFSVMIINRDMADNQRRYFNELWKIAKK